MWSSFAFILVVAVGSFFAWKWCQRRYNLADSEEHEANAITPPPVPKRAPRVPRKR